MVKLIIAGDTAPTPSNQVLFESADLDNLLGAPLKEIIHAANVFILNLETPLTNHARPIVKHGPNLMASPETIRGLQAMKPSLVSIANNHIMDQGVTGYHTTLKTLQDAGLAYIGAGDCPKEAARPYILDKNGVKVGVYACAEHEFTIVSESLPGANPFDPLESLDHITSLKAQCNYVVVLYHGGKEHYRYPSPNLQKICRKMVDKGADLVICQHSHCIGCEEKWGKGTIIYGQGNFIFDRSEDELWQASLLVEAIFGEKLVVQYIPVIKSGAAVRLAEGAEADEILSAFNQRSEEIQKPGAVHEKYATFAVSILPNYLQSFHGQHLNGLLLKILNKLSGGKLRVALMQHFYREKNMLSIRNHIECEAHRELILRGIEKMDAD